MEEVRVGCRGGQGVQVSATVERVDVSHHGGVAVNSCPVVGKEFLCPAAEHMAGAAVSGNFVDGVAVADPPEAGSPNVMVDDAEGPSASSDFADKRVVVGLSIRASTGGREDGLEAGGSESGIKGYRSWVVVVE